MDEESEAEYVAGELLWLTDEGGRKGGGVYYTPEPLVRHLVRRGVLPAYERHLETVEALLRDDPAQAARELFEFRVLDPACGSAHFLVAVVDELADRIARFLAEHPLPDVARELADLRAGAGSTYGIGVEDVALLRRLVLRRCVYGVDVSPMGAEIAKISLWLASFVPGLSLAYLDHNVRVGNSLIGVASAEQLLDADGGTTIPAMLVMEQMENASRAPRSSTACSIATRTRWRVAKRRTPPYSTRSRERGSSSTCGWPSRSDSQARARSCGLLRRRSGMGVHRRLRKPRRPSRWSIGRSTGRSFPRSSQPGEGSMRSSATRRGSSR